MDQVERVAAAIYEADHGGKWSVLVSWADGSPETSPPESIGARAPASQFAEAHEDRQHYFELAQAAINAMQDN